jgi:hypothetical protein
MTDDEQDGVLERVQSLADRVEFRDNYRLRVERDYRGVFVQVQCWRPDTFTSAYDWGAGGKAYLSPHAVDSEIFATFFGLFKSYEEHEVREAFRVDGKRIYGPHIDYRALQAVADQLDARPQPSTKEHSHGTT